MLSFSIIINTYNRCVYLEDALLALSELNYVDYEVIVVNGPSTDNTEELLSRWGDRIKVGRCPEANLGMSRNVGIQMASGDIIAFIDDDAVPHPDWLKHLASHYYDSRVGGVGGFTIDNTGVEYQVKKTLCDRFGNAVNPHDYFDERPLCVPGAPYYPSLLGTNCSFRHEALREIGGFDHTFAYLLDETDICIRLIDRGYRIVYEPDALVFHQFAPSHMRGENRIARTIYASAISKAYFIYRHGAAFSETRAAEELNKYEKEILRANKWHSDYNDISQEHRASLDDDLLFGLREGRRLGLAKLIAPDGLGDLDLSLSAPPFLQFKKKEGLRIVLISKSLPPLVEAGIARWTLMMATGLSARGHKVHLITRSAKNPSTRYQNGYWVHAVPEENTDEARDLAARKGVPAGLVGWCYAVYKVMKSLKSFGLDVISFPIWDVEGMLLVDDSSFGVVMSLHTSYALARPFKPEWTQRPLFAHFHIDKTIAAEKSMLQRTPHILANSKAIVSDIESAYGVDIKAKALVAMHGTFEPATSKGFDVATKLQNDRAGGHLRIAYVGRFEARKGFDLACDGLRRVLQKIGDVEVHFVGDVISDEIRSVLSEVGADDLMEDKRVTFHGMVTRKELDKIYLASDICVMPSRYESFGLVAIEAMAAGVVVVALDAGGLAEVIEDGSSGYLVSSSVTDGTKIAEKVMMLAQDRALLNKMKKSARQAFETHYTVDAMVAAAEPLYMRAAGRSKCI